MNINRRKFLKTGALLASCPLVAPVGLRATNLRRAGALKYTDARYYQKLSDEEIQCLLCPRECIVADGDRGYCGVRENVKGDYYSLVHSRPISLHVDPIEKKPLFHFMPGTAAFSLATAGCNVACKFCQNWEISQRRPEQLGGYALSPAEIVSLAKEQNSDCIAYTYSEPIVFYEYMYDCAVAGNRQNLPSVMISNGFINPEPMRQLAGVLKAVKIDLKAFRQKFYTELVSGKLQPVLDTLKLLHQQGVWLEIVYLVIPGRNDDAQELKEMSEWIVRELSPQVPLHFSRFYPQYLLKNIPATPPKTLTRAREIAQNAGLNFVYVGNLPGNDAQSTYCPKCNHLLIHRIGFQVLQNNLVSGSCPNCEQVIPGVWT